MKTITKKIFAFIAALSLFSITVISCGGQDDNNTPSVKDNTLSTAYDLLHIQETVTSAETSITLPQTVSGYEDVSVTWQSSNTAIIAADGTVTARDGTESDTVTLTATLTYKDDSVTKTFTVTVYQKQKVLTDSEIVAAAAAKFSFAYAGQYAYEQYDAPSSITVNDKTVTVEYNSTNTELLNISGNKINVYKTLSDNTVTLTVTFKYNEESASNVYEVEIPANTVFAISEGDNYYERTAKITFDPSNHTGIIEDSTIYTDGSKDKDVNNAKFTYTLDKDNNQITVTATHTYNEDTEEWLTIDEVADYMAQTYGKMFDLLEVLENEPTYQNMYNVMVILDDDAAQLSYDEWLKENGLEKDASAETQAEDAQRLLGFLKLGLNITDSYDEAKEAFLQTIRAQVSRSIKCDIPQNTVCEYEIEYSLDHEKYESGAWFKKIQAVYDESKEWYEQFGKWKDASDKYEITIAEFVVDGDEEDDGNWNEDFSTFTIEADGEGEEDTVYTIVDNGDGTLTLTVSTDSSNPVKLTFNGGDLSKDGSGSSED